MDIEEYFAPKRELYDCFVTFIDDPNDSESNFKDLINIINNQKILESKEELKHLLKLILSFPDNHPRRSKITSKTEKMKKTDEIFSYVGRFTLVTLNDREWSLALLGMTRGDGMTRAKGTTKKILFEINDDIKIKKRNYLKQPLLTVF